MNSSELAQWDIRYRYTWIRSNKNEALNVNQVTWHQQAEQTVRQLITNNSVLKNDHVTLHRTQTRAMYIVDNITYNLEKSNTLHTLKLENSSE